MGRTTLRRGLYFVATDIQHAVFLGKLYSHRDCFGGICYVRACPNTPPDHEEELNIRPPPQPPSHHIVSQVLSFSSPSSSSLEDLLSSTDSVRLLSLSLSFSSVFIDFFLIAVDDQWSQNVAGHVVTQKTLYMGLFVIGIPLLWFSSPFMTFFWLVGASSCLILGHACLIEPGVESEYANIEGAV